VCCWVCVNFALNLLSSKLPDFVISPLVSIPHVACCVVDCLPLVQPRRCKLRSAFGWKRICLPLRCTPCWCCPRTDKRHCVGAGHARDCFLFAGMARSYKPVLPCICRSARRCDAMPSPPTPSMTKVMRNVFMIYEYITNLLKDQRVEI
jgi:hypothetical protein